MKVIKLQILTDKGLIEYKMNAEGDMFWDNVDPELKIYGVLVLGSHNYTPLPSKQFRVTVATWAAKLQRLWMRMPSMSARRTGGGGSCS